MTIRPLDSELDKIRNRINYCMALTDAIYIYIYIYIYRVICYIKGPEAQTCSVDCCHRYGNEGGGRERTGAKPKQRVHIPG